MRIPFFIHGGQLARSRIRPLSEPGPRICSWLWRSWDRKTKNQVLLMSRNGIRRSRTRLGTGKREGPFWREEQLAVYRFVRSTYK